MKYKISKKQRIVADSEWARVHQNLKSWQTANGVQETTTVKRLKEAEQCPFPSK